MRFRIPLHGRWPVSFALTGVGLLLLALILTGRAGFSTDIFDLLPDDRRDPLAGAAIANSRAAFFNEVTAVISAPESAREQAAGAARRLRDRLQAAPLDLREPGEQVNGLKAAYLENPFLWLAPADRTALENDPAGFFRRQLAANLARPGSFDPADPAGLLARFMATLPAPGEGWTLAGGMPAHIADGNIHFPIHARLTESPLKPAVQAALERHFDEAEQAIARDCATCRLQWTGAVRFSQAARRSAERDITLLSGIATAGILLLFLLTFRAIRPLLAAMGVLAASIVTGLTASFAVFGSVHVLTLVFGTTLLGLCIDYVLHFLVHRWAHVNESGAQVLGAVAPGLALGLATSGTAFLFLLFAGFPALSQLAVFALAGLGTAWALVNAGLRDFTPPGNPDNPVARLARGAFALPMRFRIALLAMLGVAALAGLPRLQIVDDVRGLQAAPEKLLAADRAVRGALQGLPGNTASADFFLVEAASLDDALEREAALFDAANIPAAFGLSRFLPPHAVRKANRDAYAPLFADNARLLRDILAGFGFKPALGDRLAARYAAATSEELLAMPGFAALKMLRTKANGRTALIARIPGLDAVPGGAGANGNVRLVKPLQEIESTFAAIRHRSMIAVAAAYLLMLGILAWRYGIPGALRVLAPALGGAVIATGLLGLAGLPLNIFSVVALVLVLGIGADYALFLREGAAHAGTARLATAMAAATSLLSFGLLAFSSLPALGAFGFVTAAGVTTAFLAAPLALPRKRAPASTEAALDRAA